MYRARYRRIVFFFARVLLSFAFWDLLLPRLGLRARARRTRSERLRRSAVAFRALAIEMGGVMIKVGQFLSTRVDVLPAEITAELAGLQDEVPPVPFEEIRRVAEADLGASLSEKFIEFEAAPLAAASLGQVHLAALRLPEQRSAEEPHLISESRADGNGRVHVVVKIQRPNIEQLIDTDLAALRTVGEWLRRYPPVSRRADVPALLAEFSNILYQEIDYLAEGRNAETFAANFQKQPGVRVPRVLWTHTTRRVLTLENVWAIKITDYEAISKAGIDRAEVASRLLGTYLQQIFEDGFFHADPHPGNLFVRPVPRGGSRAGRAPAWQLTFVDFGMVGRVSPNVKDGLREMLIGVGTRDAVRLVKSYQMLGILLPSADQYLIEKASAKIFERYWGKSMTELSAISVQEMREFAGEFRELIYTLPFQVPHDLVFLGRTVGILSGMCTGLDPDFNIWDHLNPYARKMIAEEMFPPREALLTEIAPLVRSFLSVPSRMETMLGKMERGDIAVRMPEVSRQVIRLENAVRQVAGGIVFAALLLGGIQLHLAGEALFAGGLLAGAVLNLLWLIRNGRR